MVAAVSLLDTGNEPILVYPQEQTTDDRGNIIWRPSSTPAQVRCRVQPEYTDEPAVAGQVTVTTYRIITRDAPLGPSARVEWNGRTWDVIGEPRRYNGSPATRHIDALICTRTAAL
jgi:head-tail joining protein